jgi:hypothetical protein
MRISTAAAFLSIALFFTSISADAQEIEDGTYDATVTTSSGSYTVPVEVENGEVSHVEWPNGGNMSVDGAEIDSDGYASGYNSRGDSIEIEIDQ